ncbi:MAG: glycosyltransferase [Arenicellales bacterium]
MPRHGPDECALPHPRATGGIEHVITGLNVGGAELVLSKLVRAGSRFRHSVISLSGNGVVGEGLSRDGVAVESLDMRRDPRALMDLGRLRRLLRARSPSVVQTWLYHADLAGGLAAWRSGVPVIWNLRQTDVGRGVHKLNTVFVIRLCALLSRVLPECIVCGSGSALSAHGTMGFDTRRMVVIRNGVDTHAFRPRGGAREEVRRELGLGDDAVLVGRIGRFHPQKDYPGFIETARLIAAEDPRVVFVLAGDEVTWANQDLVRRIRRHGLERRMQLLGQRIDIPRIMAGLDLLVSSSIFGEGFPNVVAEGMACGVPCVATDVGDSAELVSDSRRVVPPGDYDGLARASLRVLSLPAEERSRTGLRDRDRIVEHFEIGAMVDSYEALYQRFAATSRAQEWRNDRAHGA